MCLKYAPKKDPFTPAWLTNVRLWTELSRFEAKYLIDGCCCSQVIPNAPPQPDTPLRVRAGRSSRMTLYNPWSFFLSPKTYMADPRYGNEDYRFNGED